MPTTIAEATSAYAADPSCTVLAGGTDLMVQLNARRAGGAVLGDVISLDRVAELSTWTVDAQRSALRVGAMTTWAQLAARPLSSWLPALAQAARTVGSPQVRSAATIGGNLVTASPAGDGITVLRALDATVTIASANGERTLTIEDLVRGVKTTALQSGEIVIRVDVPLPRGFQGFKKIGIRDAMVIALANACLVVDVERRQLRIAVGSVGPTVLRCPGAETVLRDNIDWSALRCDIATVTGAVEAVRSEVRPIDDHRASADYRRHAVGVLVERLLIEAFTTKAIPDG